MNIEHVRTPEEILRDAAAVVDGYDRNAAAISTTQRIERNMATHIERRLAIEVAAGDLAQALLRRRLRELERVVAQYQSS